MADPKEERRKRIEKSILKKRFGIEKGDYLYEPGVGIYGTKGSGERFMLKREGQNVSMPTTTQTYKKPSEIVEGFKGLFGTRKGVDLDIMEFPKQRKRRSI